MTVGSWSHSIETSGDHHSLASIPQNWLDASVCHFKFVADEVTFKLVVYIKM